MEAAYNNDNAPNGGLIPAVPLTGSMTMPQMTSGAPQTSADFWDIGDPEFIGQRLPPDHEFSNMAEVRTESGTKPWVYIVLVLLLAIIGFYAYETFVLGQDPIDQVMDLYGQIVGNESALETPVESPPVKVAQPAAPVVDAQPVAPVVPPVAGNPYWILPNKILGSQPAMGRSWTADEEETFRAGLTHRFTYQRYKTVQTVRRLRLSGSSAILWDAMHDRKLWTRMFAAVGLAEFGIEVPFKALEGALADSRSTLIANFFERFTRHPNAGQLYILRQVVRLLDERGRLVALRGIAHSQDSLRDLYMIAATQDPGRHVRKWVKQELSERPIPPEHVDELLAVVQGRVNGSYLVNGGLGAPPNGGAAAAGEVEESDEDLDQELESLSDDGGDVELYEDEGTPSAVNDTPDADTFESDQ